MRRFIFHEGLTIVTSSPQRCQLRWFSNLTRLPPGCLLAELCWACPPEGNFGANPRKPEEIMCLIWLGKTSICPQVSFRRWSRMGWKVRALLKLQSFDPDLDKWQEMDGRTGKSKWFFLGRAETKKRGCQRNNIKKQKLEIQVGKRMD